MSDRLNIAMIFGNVRRLRVINGREVEMKVNATHIQWRYVGEETWTNLIALSELAGADGREVELRENAGWVEWRYVGDATWTQLYEIPSGGTDTGFDVYIDFLDTTEFVYNCPVALKFTQVISESTAPTLSVSLNTNMAQFDKLTVTPAAVGLVILKGELL